MGKNKTTTSYNYPIKKFWNRIRKHLSIEQKEKIVPIDIPNPKCSYCGCKNAIWKHNIVFDYACEECVPRGCSCNLYKKFDRTSFDINDYEYELDENGREIPCEEWYKI